VRRAWVSQDQGCRSSKCASPVLSSQIHSTLLSSPSVTARPDAEPPDIYGLESGSLHLSSWFSGWRLSCIAGRAKDRRTLGGGEGGRIEMGRVRKRERGTKTQIRALTGNGGGKVNIAQML
jgi:hypothetical protein